MIWSWLLGEPGHANERNVECALQGRQQQEKNGSGEGRKRHLVYINACAQVRKQHVGAFTTTA